jgi:hypothetical protein
MRSDVLGEKVPFNVQTAFSGAEIARNRSNQTVALPPSGVRSLETSVRSVSWS